jgi:hypothetical protein
VEIRGAGTRPTLPPRGRGALAPVGLVVPAFFLPTPAIAWIYGEHRAITARGIDTLDPQERAILDALWERARP